MIEQIQLYTLPAAYALLPRSMASPAASAFLLAIGLQESGFLTRQQVGNGEARSFWQFNVNGLSGILQHPETAGPLETVLRALCYEPPHTAKRCLLRIQHNDTLACCCARLLIWTLPDPLPDRDQAGTAWDQYLAAWRPGKPRPGTWASHYHEAWQRIEGSR